MMDEDKSGIDPERPRDGAFDKDDHFSGEVYSIEREREMGAKLPSGTEDAVASGGDPTRPATIAGRAHFDAATGEVHAVGLAEDEH